MFIAFEPLPTISLCFQVGRSIFGERYQSIFVVREIRALELRLVVTKVMYCGDLLCAGGKPSREQGEMEKIGDKSP